MNIPELIEQDLRSGWVGTVDEWWAEHPWVTTVNSIAPTFTYLKQEGRIVPALKRRPTRAGGLANVWRWAEPRDPEQIAGRDDV